MDIDKKLEQKDLDPKLKKALEEKKQILSNDKEVKK